MHIALCIDRLHASRCAMLALVDGLSPEQARWRPSYDRWSVLEVICHLADEEREDFRQRLDLTLHAPGTEWPPTDPEGWAVERDYNARDLDDATRDFAAERTRSLAWLRTIGDPDWSRVSHHRSGPITAGDLMASWVAHDLIHLRQLTRLQFEQFARAASPANTAYAGRW